MEPVSADAIDHLIDEGRFRQALALGTRILESGNRDGRVVAAVAEAALRTGDPGKAVEICRRGVAAHPRSSGLHFRLGQLLQFVDDFEAADECFRLAATLDSRHHIIPFRIAPDEFDALAGESVASLPQGLATILDSRGTTISVRPLPSLDGIVEDHLDPFALGYHFSNPLGLPGSGYATHSVPDAIELYQLTIENWCGTEAELRQEIRKTVLHEMGHAFGMDHAALDEAGY